MTCIVVAGPSGVGKGTILKSVRKEFGEFLTYSVSHTTRQKRPGEQNGVDYYFISKDEFLNMIRENQFLEYAEFSGNYYGTSVPELQRISCINSIFLIECELNGVQNIRRSTLNKVLYVFIFPPNLKELEKRLRLRATESDEMIQKRLTVAAEELKLMNYLPANLRIVNDDLNMAVAELSRFVADQIPHASKC